MQIFKFALPAIALSLLCGCATRDLKPLSVSRIDENWLTSSNVQDNVDSPTVWHDKDGKGILVITAKQAQCLNVYDASSGASLRTVGSEGSGVGQFLRPNGIWSFDDFLLVVERDNRRVQAFRLPDFKPLGSFGEKDLGKPYGLCVIRGDDGSPRVYVTDNYETASGRQVPQTEMGHRVRMYKLEVGSDSVKATLESTLGDTSGAGILNTVESIYADTEHGRLLVADEDMDVQGGRNIKIYTLDGKFTGKTIGDGLYRNQPEGIAMLSCTADDARWQKAGIAGRSYYFLTDQGTDVNYFHVFDADSLEYLGSVELAHTLNTDGIWIDPTASSTFPLGALYAVDNDRRAGATGLDRMLTILARKTTPQSDK